jgi:hypothetical protein
MWWWIGGAVAYFLVGLATSLYFAARDSVHVPKPSDERMLGCAVFGLIWPLTWVLFVFLFAAMACYVGAELKKKEDAKSANEGA